jgi:phage tail-like protein
MAEYPLPKFHFRVEWGGTRIGFTEITGLETEIEAITYRDGASPEYHDLQMPGRPKYSDLTMKRGVFPSDNEFFEWMKTQRMHKIERRDITISLLNEEHNPVMIWKVKNAWPSKITSTDLKSDDNGVAIETLVLKHEGLVIQND